MDPRDKLLVVERPRDEVVAAALERVHAVDRVGARSPSTITGTSRSHERPGSPSRRTRQTSSAGASGSSTDEHEVGPLALDQLERLAPAVRAEHGEAVARQVPLEETPVFPARPRRGAAPAT